MTPIEEAEELINKMYQLFPKEVDIFSGLGDLSYEDNMIKAKGCALIAVDEIINTFDEPSITADYWYQVKQEIEKL